jgi:hypothetical protein
MNSFKIFYDELSILIILKKLLKIIHQLLCNKFAITGIFYILITFNYYSSPSNYIYYSDLEKIPDIYYPDL